MASSGTHQPTGPPYLPTTATVGGLPTVHEDVPILSVFIALYLGVAAANIAVFVRNIRRGHKFVFSILFAWFAVMRVATCALRISWAAKPRDIGIAIAAQVLVNAGVLLLYIINVLFAQRILRGSHPGVGWNPLVRAMYRASYALLAVALILVVSMIVLKFNSLNRQVQTAALWSQRAAVLYMLLMAFSPLPVLALALLTPRSKRAEPFGRGAMPTKALVVVVAACFCTLIGGFRVGTVWSPQPPRNHPAWWDSKACFYCFNFMLEILTLYWYTAWRADRLFHVPNGSSKHNTYAVPATEGGRPNSAATDQSMQALTVRGEKSPV